MANVRKSSNNAARKQPDKSLVESWDWRWKPKHKGSLYCTDGATAQCGEVEKRDVSINEAGAGN